MYNFSLFIAEYWISLEVKSYGHNNNNNNNK